MRSKTLFVVGLCVISTTSLAAFIWLTYWLVVIGRMTPVYEIRSYHKTGALVATDEDGLRKIHLLYALPKACTETNVRAADVLTVYFVCSPLPKPITLDMVTKGLVWVPEGVEIQHLAGGGFLPDGQIVKPYSANTYDMARDGATSVSRGRILQAPNEGREGWIHHDFIRVKPGTVMAPL